MSKTSKYPTYKSKPEALAGVIIKEKGYESPIPTPPEPTDNPAYFVDHATTIERKLYGGVDTLANIGAQDIYSHTGQVNATDDLANLIIKSQQDRHKKQSYYNSDPNPKPDQLKIKYGSLNKYGWQQETIELIPVSSSKGLTVKYTFPNDVQDGAQNPILVFKSEELKKFAENCQLDDLDDLIYESISSIEITMGGQQIDKIKGYDIKFMQQIFNLTYYRERNKKLIKKYGKFYCPLPIDCLVNQFLRLTCMKYHEATLSITFDSNLITKTPKVSLKYDSIFINPVLNKELKRHSHEIFVKQVQNNGPDTLILDNQSDKKIQLNFNHTSFGLLIYFMDSHKRIIKDDDLFEKVTFYSHKRPQFVGTPDSMRYESLRHLGQQDTVNDPMWDGFYWMPFSRADDANIPFKTFSALNFNRHGGDDFYLKFDFSNESIQNRMYEEIQVNVTTINSHVLRIMSGMVGLAFSK